MNSVYYSLMCLISWKFPLDLYVLLIKCESTLLTWDFKDDHNMSWRAHPHLSLCRPVPTPSWIKRRKHRRIQRFAEDYWSIVDRGDPHWGILRTFCYIPCSPFRTIRILSFLAGLAFLLSLNSELELLALRFSHSIFSPSIFPRLFLSGMVRSYFCSGTVFYISPWTDWYTFSLLVTKLGKWLVNIFCILAIDQIQLLGRTYNYFQCLKAFIFNFIFSQGYCFSKAESVPFFLSGKNL